MGPVPVCGFLQVLDSEPSCFCWPHPRGLLYISNPKDGGRPAAPEPQGLQLESQQRYWVRQGALELKLAPRTQNRLWGAEGKGARTTVTAGGLLSEQGGGVLLVARMQKIPLFSQEVCFLYGKIPGLPSLFFFYLLLLEYSCFIMLY